MKKMSVPIMTLIMLVTLFTSGESEELEWPDAEAIEPPAGLKNSKWNLDLIISWEIQDAIRKELEFITYGIDSENGLCILNFDDKAVQIQDSEGVESRKYFYFENETLSIGDEIYSISQIDDSILELSSGNPLMEEECGETLRFSRIS